VTTPWLSLGIQTGHTDLVQGLQIPGSQLPVSSQHLIKWRVGGDIQLTGTSQGRVALTRRLALPAAAFPGTDHIRTGAAPTTDANRVPGEQARTQPTSGAVTSRLDRPGRRRDQGVGRLFFPRRTGTQPTRPDLLFSDDDSDLVAEQVRPISYPPRSGNRIRHSGTGLEKDLGLPCGGDVGTAGKGTSGIPRAGSVG
jgi:hypothetical protein